MREVAVVLATDFKSGKVMFKSGCIILRYLLRPTVIWLESHPDLKPNFPDLKTLTFFDVVLILTKLKGKCDLNHPPVSGTITRRYARVSSFSMNIAS